jgi:enhancing lycopene biosynthesis protein 2
LDGTDPSEAILLIAAIQFSGHEPVILSIAGNQFHVVDHLSGEEMEGVTRSILQESARLYRGKIHLLADISPKLLDAIIIPGGQGPIKNFMGSEDHGKNVHICPEVEKFLKEVHENGGSIGAVSLAEFVLTRIFGPFPEGKGCLEIGATEVVVDEDRKMFLTPGNLTAKDLVELQLGLRALVSAILGKLD